jgi:hypothetical protein
MKKAILIILTGLFSYVVMAQQDTLKPHAKNVGITFNVTGLINNISLGSLTDKNNNNALLGRYYLKNDLALRTGLGVYSVNNKWSTSDSVGTALVAMDSVQKRFDFTVTLGIEKHLGNTRRLDPYVGADLVVGAIGKTKINVDEKTSDNTGTATRQHIIQQDGGAVFGVSGLVGFNYFISRNFAIGAEYQLGYQVQRFGGDYSETTVNTPISGQSTSTFTKSINKTKYSGFSVNSTAGILLSIFF